LLDPGKKQTKRERDWDKETERQRTQTTKKSRRRKKILLRKKGSPSKGRTTRALFIGNSGELMKRVAVGEDINDGHSSIRLVREKRME